jgi:hypothetical protein
MMWRSRDLEACLATIRFGLYILVQTQMDVQVRRARKCLADEASGDGDHCVRINARRAAHAR